MSGIITHCSAGILIEPPKLNGESAGYAWVDIGQWPKPLHNGAKVTLYKNGGTEKLYTILDINS